MLGSFKEYLQEVEQTISFDPGKESPEELVRRAKQTYRMSANQPARAIRSRQQDIASQEKAIKAQPDDPLAADRLAIKKMEERIARMKMALSRKEEMAQKRQASATAAGA